MAVPWKRLSENVDRAWQQVAEGWHELISRSKNALTHYSRSHDAVDDAANQWLRACPNWGLVAGEIEQDEANVHVRIELPGLDKKDIELEVHDDRLVVRGEKRFARESRHGNFTLMERSYGRFERSFGLPCAVDADKATARYQDGVLSVSLPRLRAASKLKIS